jgi:hypothetical protein
MDEFEAEYEMATDALEAERAAAPRDWDAESRLH